MNRQTKAKIIEEVVMEQYEVVEEMEQDLSEVIRENTLDKKQ